MVMGRWGMSKQIVIWYVVNDDGWMGTQDQV